MLKGCQSFHRSFPGAPLNICNLRQNLLLASIASVCISQQLLISTFVDSLPLEKLTVKVPLCVLDHGSINITIYLFFMFFCSLYISLLMRSLTSSSMLLFSHENQLCSQPFLLFFFAQAKIFNLGNLISSLEHNCLFFSVLIYIKVPNNL